MMFAAARQRTASCHSRLRLLSGFLGRRRVALFGVGQLSSLFLAGVEYCFAILLLLFLYAIGLVNASALPRSVPVNLAPTTLTSICTVFLVVALLQAIFKVILFQTKIMFTEGAHARMSTLLGYLMLRPSRDRFLPLSEANHLTTEIFPKATSFLFYGSQFVSFAIKATAIAVIMLLLAPVETLIGLSGLAIMMLAVLSLNRVTNAISARVPAAERLMERSKVRIAANWLLIRVLRLEDRELGAYLQAVDSYYGNSIEAYLFGNLGGAVLPVFGVLLVGAIAVVGFGPLHTSSSTLVSFLYLFLRFEQMVADGSNLVGGMFAYRHQLAGLMELVGGLTRSQLSEAIDAAAQLPVRFEKRAPRIRADRRTARLSAPPSIEIRNLAFAWRSGERPVLSGVSKSVPPGRLLAVSGPNGSGKSTLLSIVLGALAPDEGEVLIDGMPAGDYLLRHADNVGFVGPVPYLGLGTIRDNLTYGLRDRCSDTELLGAVEEVGFSKLLSELPDGLGHLLGENGEGLSSGQKQRLSIARALLRRPRLLVLDEPFAHLDGSTVRRISGTLLRMRSGCTTLIVSHDPQVIGAADDIIDLGAEHAAAALRE